jgi:hypothetical protein
MATRVPLSGRESLLSTRDSIRLGFLDETNGRLNPYCLGLPKGKLWAQSSLSNRSADDRCAITDERTAAVLRRLYPAHPGPA